MEQFKQIYRILSILHNAMDLEEWDSKLLSPEGLGISLPKWSRLMAMLLKEGYRITPAYAGQICWDGCWIRRSKDHPRIRGTNFFTWILLADISGSPPHTRDKLGWSDYATAGIRITPAYAGQILLLEA